MTGWDRYVDRMTGADDAPCPECGELCPPGGSCPECGFDPDNPFPDAGYDDAKEALAHERFGR